MDSWQHLRRQPQLMIGTQQTVRQESHIGMPCTYEPRLGGHGLRGKQIAIVGKDEECTLLGSSIYMLIGLLRREANNSE